MKYVVLSFDDGTIDFKINAFPILKRFNYVATINIISGFSDRTIEVGYDFLSVDDIKFFNSIGYEIANHTNRHMKHGSFEELKICHDKLQEWCSTKEFGIAMPKYAKPNFSARKYIRENKPLYVTYDTKAIGLFNNLFKNIFLKFRAIFNKDQKSFFDYLVNRCIYKKGAVNKFLRLSVKRETDPKLLFESLQKIPDDYCLTICFHSISDDPDNCYYPEGAWSINNFFMFISLLSNDKNISVIAQKEACKKINEK